MVELATKKRFVANSNIDTEFNPDIICLNKQPKKWTQSGILEISKRTPSSSHSTLNEFLNLIQVPTFATIHFMGNDHFNLGTITILIKYVNWVGEKEKQPAICLSDRLPRMYECLIGRTDLLGSRVIAIAKVSPLAKPEGVGDPRGRHFLKVVKEHGIAFR